MKFRRTTALPFALALLFITAHRLPAPITEVQQATPTPTITSTAPTTNVPSPTSKPKTGRFTGTWNGIVRVRNPLVGGGGTHQLTCTINAEENVVNWRISGAGSYKANATVNGKTLSWKGGLFSHWTLILTLTENPRVVTYVLDDKIWGKSSGPLNKVD